MKKIYPAGPFSWKAQILAHAVELERLGYIITAEWLTQGTCFTNPDNSTNTKFAGLHAECAILSTRDLRNIAECDTLILFEPGVPLERNTRVAEFGVALAWGKQCIVIGPEDDDKKDIISNIFVMLREKPKDWGGTRKYDADVALKLERIKPVIAFQTWNHFIADILNPRVVEFCSGCGEEYGLRECGCPCGSYRGYKTRSGLLVREPGIPNSVRLFTV